MLEREGLRGKISLEASGGINPTNVEDFAATGVDVISSSYITMRAPAVDMGLRVVDNMSCKSPKGGGRESSFSKT
jgi:nicotinate-nucleotide pyrophosphorylase (carboxylating)